MSKTVTNKKMSSTKDELTKTKGAHVKIFTGMLVLFFGV